MPGVVCPYDGAELTLVRAAVQRIPIDPVTGQRVWAKEESEVSGADEPYLFCTEGHEFASPGFTDEDDALDLSEPLLPLNLTPCPGGEECRFGTCPVPYTTCRDRVTA